MVPPHKQASATPGALRAEMCGCFRALSPCVEVSLWEMGQGGKNYTVDTLCMLQKAYPGARLHLVPWQRHAAFVPRLAALARYFTHFSAGGAQPRKRPMSQPLRPPRRPLRPEGADILFAPGTVLEISSTQVRALAARGGDISPLVPAEVQRIILREGLYRGGTDTTYKEARCH